MEEVSLTCHLRMAKKLTRKLLRWVKIMTTQLIIYYRLIAIDLSKKTKLKGSRQIDVMGKLENQAYGWSSNVSEYRKSEETTSGILQNSVSIL